MRRDYMVRRVTPSAPPPSVARSDPSCLRTRRRRLAPPPPRPRRRPSVFQQPPELGEQRPLRSPSALKRLDPFEPLAHSPLPVHWLTLAPGDARVCVLLRRAVLRFVTTFAPVQEGEHGHAHDGRPERDPARLEDRQEYADGDGELEHPTAPAAPQLGPAHRAAITRAALVTCGRGRRPRSASSRTAESRSR